MSHPASMRLTAYIMKQNSAISAELHQHTESAIAADTIIPDFSRSVKMINDQTYFPSFIQYDE